MDDNPEIHEGLSASRMPCTLLTHAYMPVFTTWTHWWETTKPCQTPNKKRSLRVFFLSTLLLPRVFVWTAPRRWEWRNTGLFFVGNFVECLNIYRIFLFEYMCITFCSNSGKEREITGQFECMSHYLLLELLPRGHLELLVWMYVALPFTQTETWGNQGWIYVVLPFVQT